MSTPPSLSPDSLQLIETLGSLLLGLAALVVSIAAVLAARASNKSARSALELAESSHLRQVELEQRSERTQIADSILSWCVVQWGVDKPSGDARAEALRLKNAFSIRLAHSELPGTGSLQDILWGLEEDLPDTLGQVGFAYLSGYYTRTVHQLVATWIREPERVESMRAKVDRARFRALGEAVKKDMQFVSDRAELLRKRDEGKADQREEADEKPSPKGSGEIGRD